MRKILFLLVALLATTALWAYDFKSGDLYYNITSNSKPYTVEVADKGLDGYYNGDIVIPASVTYEGIKYAVTRIGVDAFNANYCTSIKIPESVKSIGTWSFANSGHTLNSIVIPNSVETIEMEAFKNCTYLSSVTLGNNITSIGYEAFGGCFQLSETYYTGDIADWCNIHFESESSNPIYNSRNLYINNEEVKDLIIPNTMDSISTYAFRNCMSITSVTIPSSIVSFDQATFRGCHSLTSIVVQEGNTKYDSRNNCNAIIETAANTLILGTRTSTIPNNVTTIASGAFRDCSAMSKITIPSSVTSIGWDAFRGCTFAKDNFTNNSLLSSEENDYWGATLVDKDLDGLLIKNDTVIACRPNVTSITIPNGVKGGIDYGIFKNCPLLTNVIWDIKNYSDCEYVLGPFAGNKITSITFGNNVEYIPAFTFDCISSLKNIIISDNVISIGNAAFRSCEALTSVSLGKGLRNIGWNAFSNCVNLKSITIPQSVSSIGEAAFYGCTELTSIVWNPTSCTGYFDEENVSPLFYDCNKVSSVVFGDQVTEIPMALCYNMSALSSIVIPKNVTSIERMAFYGCESLKSVYCYADTTPAVAESSFTNYDATLYVPCNQIERYKAHTTWTKFARIECITSEKVETEEVVVMPSINDAIIIWPASADAETYTIIVTAGSEIHSTLTFDAEGQLLGISYAPSRYAAIPARYAAETGTGFKFTLSGLEDGVEYVYEIIVKNAQDEEIESYVGTFTTQSDTSTDVDNLHSPILKTQKILRNGQLYILKDSKTYNAMGQEL